MKINLLVLLGLFFFISNSLSAKNIDVEIKSQSCFCGRGFVNGVDKVHGQCT